MNKKKNLQNNKKGFALLFSVLLSSLLLSIGLSIFNISLKEVQISFAGRESQYAFYAADSGLECALYWDSLSTSGAEHFATSSSSSVLQSISCAGISNISMSVVASSTNSATNSFGFGLLTNPTNNDLGQPCVEVKVYKETTEGILKTTIESRGTNICDEKGRRVERGLKIVY
ncbi:MAG: hypothetical protein WCW14_00725 [Candidatus Paceibacterota bacterium]|jgi:Tfp pilus assembly protein PilX